MKKETIFILSILAVTASACASRGPQAGASTELSSQARLAIGTVKLEETNYAITPEQAKKLLPMWYVLQDLNDSDTAAQEEIDGLTNQIEETLTADQTKAIDEMNLTRMDMFTAMQSENNPNGGSVLPQGGPAAGGTGGGNFQPGGNFSGGNFPGGGNMPGANPAAGTVSNGSGNPQPQQPLSNTVPSALFDRVIEYLQEKLENGT